MHGDGPPVLLDSLLEDRGQIADGNVLTRLLHRGRHDVVEAALRDPNGHVVQSVRGHLGHDLGHDDRHGLATDTQPHQPHHQLPQREDERPRRPQENIRRDPRQLVQCPDHLDINPVPAGLDILRLLFQLPRLQVRHIGQRFARAVVELRRELPKRIRHPVADVVRNTIDQPVKTITRRHNPLRESPVRLRLLTHQADLPRRQRPTRDQDRQTLPPIRNEMTLVTRRFYGHRALVSITTTVQVALPTVGHRHVCVLHLPARLAKTAANFVPLSSSPEMYCPSVMPSSPDRNRSTVE
ncbi:hypothetical protein [Kibdelosporangium philippinense]|uniref:hypothetical protein n=1 Tax=Kibdelosporangium philippinense TaxID=211113 RepID=UPI00360D4B81